MKEFTVGMVAGEVSGDHLGADLIRVLKEQFPSLKIIGIGGPKMIEAGCQSLFPMERLSVMGVWEVARRLPQILTMRYQLIRYFLNNPPDVFVAIDAPDFNLTVEEKLKAAGIPTVHYVSPTVWAWKQWRIKKISRSVDKMLTLLPFEEAFYQKHKVPVKFVGHPLADQIDLKTDRSLACDQLDLPRDKKIIAILPGSRSNEIKYLGPLFIETALWCSERVKDVIFVAPMVSEAIKQQFLKIIQTTAPQLKIQLVDGQSRLALAAAHGVLLASGTATLEAMLVKRPMIVAYRMSKLSFMIAKRMIKTPYIALPNLLANKALVPELVQDKATVESLGHLLLDLLNNTDQVSTLTDEFDRLHRMMRCNASQRAAESVIELMTQH